MTDLERLICAAIWAGLFILNYFIMSKLEEKEADKQDKQLERNLRELQLRRNRSGGYK